MSTQGAVSLNSIGFKFSPVVNKRDAAKGWAYKVQAPPMSFYLKKSKSGRLTAFNSKKAKVETTIRGLSFFKQEGNDLIGEKYVPKTSIEDNQLKKVA